MQKNKMKNNFTSFIFLIFNFMMNLNPSLYLFQLFTSKVEFEKSSAYECSFPHFKKHHILFEVQFAFIAIMFLLFDIEVLYLYPLIISMLLAYYENVDTKIFSLYYSWFLVFIYFFIFLLLLYMLRFFNLGKETDLKFIYQIFLFCKYILLLFPFIYQLFFFIILVFILFILFFSLYLVNSYLLQNLLKLFIYYNKKIKNTKLKSFLSDVGTNDIISYILTAIIYKLTIYQYRNNTMYCEKTKYGLILHTPRLSKFHPYRFSFIIYNKKYNLFISLLPIIFIVFECILNNCVIKYFYYFMIFFVPILLLKKLTSFFSKEPPFIISILWDLYYKVEEKNIIYALSPEIKSLWDLYFINNLQSYDLMDTDFQFTLKLTIRFILNYPERNGYINDLAVLNLVYDNEKKCYRVYEEIEEEDENYNVIYKLGKEWYLIAIK